MNQISSFCGKAGINQNFVSTFNENQIMHLLHKTKTYKKPKSYSRFQTLAVFNVEFIFQLFWTSVQWFNDVGHIYTSVKH